MSGSGSGSQGRRASAPPRRQAVSVWSRRRVSRSGSLPVVAAVWLISASRWWGMARRVLGSGRGWSARPQRAHRPPCTLAGCRRGVTGWWWLGHPTYRPAPEKPPIRRSHPMISTSTCIKRPGPPTVMNGAYAPAMVPNTSSSATSAPSGSVWSLRGGYGTAPHAIGVRPRTVDLEYMGRMSDAPISRSR